MLQGWKLGLHDKAVEVFHSTIIKGKKSNACVIISKRSYDDWRVLIFLPDNTKHTKHFKFVSKTKAKKFATNYMLNWSATHKKQYHT